MIVSVIVFALTTFSIGCCHSHVNHTLGEDVSTNKNGDRFIWVTDSDGAQQLIDLDAPVDYKLVKNDPGQYNFYVLYTRQNAANGQILYVGDINGLLNSYFDPTKQTKILIHGFTGHYLKEFSTLVREALLQAGDFNVFVVDWSYIADGEFPTVAATVPSIGSAVAAFLFSLNRLGVSYSNMHIIGYSLGAHVAGIAGRTLAGQIARITGLDPGGPLFGIDSHFRIVETDAIYVEIIHTDVYGYGFYERCGDADFYPNQGGFHMPGCDDHYCSHEKAFEYYAATVKYNHLIGRSCDSVLQATSSICTGSNFLHMGNAVISKTGSGIYQLFTRADYPY